MSRTRRLVFGLLVTVLVLAGVEGSLRLTGVVDQGELLSPLLFQQLDGQPGALPQRDGWAQWHDGTWFRSQLRGFRAITLGGSATAGDGVTPFASFSHQLQRLAVRADPSRPAEVINMGRGGVGSRQVVRLLEEGLAAFQPQVAIVYSGNNEFHELRALEHASPAYSANLEVTRRRLHTLHTYRALQHLLGRDRLAPFEPLGRDAPPVHELPTTADAQDRELARKLYAENLRRMAQLAREVGVPLILATVGDNRAGWVDAPPQRSLTAREEQLLAEIDGLRARRERGAVLALAEQAWPDLHDERAFYRVGRALLELGLLDQARRFLDQAELVMARPNRSSIELRAALREVAHDEGVILCEVADGLDARSAQGIAGNALFVDACHPSPEGHAHIAAMLAACAERAGLLTTGGASSWEAPLDRDPWRLDHHAERLQTTLDNDTGAPAMAAVQAGHAAFTSGDHALAWEHYARALELGGPSDALLLDQALVRWHQGRSDDVEALLSSLAPAEDPEIENWKSLLTR